MKLQVTFKTPDAIDTALDDVWDLEDRPNLSDLTTTIEKFVRYGELVTIEFDAETRTARVVPL